MILPVATLVSSGPLALPWAWFNLKKGLSIMIHKKHKKEIVTLAGNRPPH
jgi:hypothetical protein